MSLDRHHGAGLGGVALLLAAWFFLPDRGYVIPPLGDVISRGWTMAGSGELFFDAYTSLWRVCAGAGIGILLSVCVGVVSVIPIVRSVLSGPIELARPIPPIAWIPLMLVMFGVGNASAIALVALAVFFPVVVAIILALDGVDQDLLFASRSLGATTTDRVWHVYLPSMAPTLIAGVRLGIGIGWFSVVAAEMVGSYGGLGYGIQIASLNLEMERFFVYLFAIGLCGFTMNTLMLWLDRRVNAWRPGINHVR